VPPAFIPPERASLVDRPPPGDRSLHEIEFDGNGTVARVEGGKATMTSRMTVVVLADWPAAGKQRI
jgi:bifunctional non-homologous end joining protein LigD